MLHFKWQFLTENLWIIKKHPEINWENLISIAIENYINNLEVVGADIDIKELTRLSEHSLKEFLEGEPDLYTDDDLKERYQ